MSEYHNPVLLKPSVDALVLNPDGFYADATFGGGGHSREILSRLSPKGHLMAFDRDADALAQAPDDPRFILIHNNFRFIHNYTLLHAEGGLDGILADLGVSSHQFDTAERGFSFRFDAPLDMRMNQKSDITAAEIINTADEERLSSLFRLYGELPSARRLAHAIVTARTTKAITTTAQLIATAEPFVNPRQQKKELAQIFQALRIEVNDEMGALKCLLTASTDLIKEGGRLAVITYHSLEDRLVKNFMRSGNIDGNVEKDFFGRQLSPFRQVNSKPIVADESEVNNNPRSRSAKLRIAEKV